MLKPLRYQNKRKDSGVMDFSLLSNHKKRTRNPTMMHTWNTSAILCLSIMNQLKKQGVQFLKLIKMKNALIQKMRTLNKKLLMERKNYSSSCKWSRRNWVSLKNSKKITTFQTMSICYRSQEILIIRICKLPNTRTSIICRWLTIFEKTRWKIANNSWSLKEIEHTSKGQLSRTSSFFLIRDVKLALRRRKNKTH